VDLLKTPLYGRHLERKAKMIPFDGFDMPVQYTSIIEEHLAVRSAVGIFDVSHMGEIELRGKDAVSFADYLVTNTVSTMQPGEVKYSPLCYPHGGQVDDIFVYFVSDDFVLLVVNASPDYSVKDFAWILQNKNGFRVDVSNKSADYGEVAVQGPAAGTLVAPLVDEERPVEELKRFHFVHTRLFNKDVLISRTGYTGEDGFEIFSSAEDIGVIWDGLLEAGGKLGITPCGLGARDTLRFEVCYWLYGNDIDETINPLETGQGWTVKFDKGSFIGKEALLDVKRKGVRRKLVGLHVPRGGIARHGMEVRKAGQRIGYITSGNYCPTLKQVYAIAMLDMPYAERESTVDVVIREKEIEASVVDMPFVLPVNRRK